MGLLGKNSSSAKETRIPGIVGGPEGEGNGGGGEKKGRKVGLWGGKFSWG